MATQKENWQSNPKRERVRYHLRRFIPIVAEIYRLFGIIKKYQIMLNQPRLLFRTRKSWIAYLIAFRLYQSYSSGNIGANDIRGYIGEIKKYDIELAETIGKLLPAVKSESRIFGDLIIAHSKGREFFVAYITTHVQELIARAKSIKDTKLSQQLVALFSAISGHEVDTLKEYAEDCKNWNHPRFALNYNIEFFRRRFDLYIKGGFEDNTQFMGLYKDFGDKKLTEMMWKNDKVRNLWRYYEQLNYLTVLIGLCVEAQKDPAWNNGFYKPSARSKESQKGFWQDFNRYAEQFAAKYGNADFAAELKSQKSEVGESPFEWGGEWQASEIKDTRVLEQRGTIYVVIEGTVYTLAKDGFLPKLLRRLRHPSYQRKAIVGPASTELQRIFREREDELLRDKDNSANELIRILSGLSGLGIDRKKVVSEFRRMLGKRKGRLLRELENETNELIGEISGPFADCNSFMNEQKTTMAKVDLEYREARSRRLDFLADQNMRYFITQLSKGNFLEEITALVLTDGSISSEQLALLQMMQLKRFDHLTENDFEQMENLIPRSQDVAVKLRNIVDRYLKGILVKKYLIKIEDIGRLKIDVDDIKEENFNVKPKDIFDRSLQAEVVFRVA